MWLSVTGRINWSLMPLMCLFMFLATHAQIFFNTANVAIAIQNFSDYSVTIVSIIKILTPSVGAVCGNDKLSKALVL
ncbi:hypothetical protein LguiB_002857 [Lonicera macranthoides]